MDKIEKIRSEIERLAKRADRLTDKDHASHNAEMERYGEDYWNGYGDLAYALLSFLDTLSEESDKSLEEAAKEYAEGPECTWVGTTALEEAFKDGAKWQKQHDTAPVDGNELLHVADKSYKIGWRDCKQQMLRIANDRYEQAMTFVTGNSEVDQAIQMDRLALVKIIEESEK